MANDMDMLRDIAELNRIGLKKQGEELRNLFIYKYGLGESKYTCDSEFDNAKLEYEKKYGFLDNYV